MSSNDDNKIGLYRYFKQMGEYQLLTAEQEQELGKAVFEGQLAKEMLEGTVDSVTDAEKRFLEEKAAEGHRALDLLVLHNLRLVVNLAAKALKSTRDIGLTLEDLIQEGTLGLIRAIQKFDYRKGFRLSTYASWWIRQSIQRGIIEKGSIVRVPSHVFEASRRYSKARYALLQENGTEPSAAEVAGFLDEPLKKVEATYASQQDILSLDKNYLEDTDTEEEGTPLTYYSITEVANEDTDPFRIVLQEEMRDRIEGILSLIDPRDALTIKLYYGLVDSKSWTLEEIGDTVGVSRERVRQRKDQGLRDIRDILAAENVTFEELAL